MKPLHAASWWLSGAAALLSWSLAAQLPFAMDPSFRTQFNDWYVSSILPLEDGKVIVSGQTGYPGAPPFTFHGVTRLNSDGSADPTFSSSNLGRGKMVRHGDAFYVASNTIVRRLLINGSLDPMFGSMNSSPYFSSLQGGDYHVYPDGSLLVSGAHTVSLPDSGWSGLHNLIWFTNTGRLDTTRAPRKGNGVIYRIKELPDGKFMCTGPMTEFEGQPTSYIFRVQADGALDTSFYTGVNWGQAFAYLPLADGRCYVGGLFRTPESSFNRRLVRFLADGSLDTSFNNDLHFDKGILSGLDGVVGTISALPEGRLLVTGSFQAVDGIAHNGLCIIDSTGQVVPQLQEQGCGSYVYQTQNSSTTYGTIDGVHFMPNNMMYIWGAYHGYDDGTTNAPLQRFVTRLYGPDFSTRVAEADGAVTGTLWPVPTTDQLNIKLTGQITGVRIVDVQGRTVLTRSIQAENRVTLSVAELAPGVYSVIGDGRFLGRFVKEAW